jgi:hypothetical protein
MPAPRSLAQRAALLRLGLRDRDAKVQAAATKMLAAWLAEAGSEVADLLKKLHVENYTGARPAPWRLHIPAFQLPACLPASRPASRPASLPASLRTPGP